MSSTDANAYAGSWFSTGFFGHSRSRRRNEVTNHYRQLARPEPPELFLKRLQDYRMKRINSFSEHDTRNSREFINVTFDLPVSNQARTLKTARVASRDVIAWSHNANKKEPSGNAAAPDADTPMSSYTATYSPSKPKHISPNLPLYKEGAYWTSSYRNAFCNDRPVPNTIRSSAANPLDDKETRMRRSLSMTDLSHTSQSKRPSSETVSSCLVWREAQPRQQLNREQVQSNRLENSSQNDSA